MKKLKVPIVLGIAIAGIANSSSHATVLPVPDETRNRVVTKDETLQNESNYKKLYNEELEKKLGDLRAKFKQQYEKTKDIPNKQAIDRITEASPNPELPTRIRTTQPHRFSNGYVVRPPLAPSVISFAVSEDAGERKTVIPVGSSVHAVLVTGVEANVIEPYPILLALDTAFVGPNHRRIDLSNCFMLAKAKANLSTERVVGETTEISCVKDDGEHIKRQAKGYLSGSDSTFGVQGTLLSNQKQVFLTAVLASLAKGAGEAVAMAQKTTQIVNANGSTQAATNVTGNPALLAGGQAVADASSMIAEWYLSFAKQLVPSIAIGSGGEGVFITLLDSIEIPQLDSEESE